ncbi:MAG: acetyl esterase/lipase [Planctomycetota bacterium]
MLLTISACSTQQRNYAYDSSPTQEFELGRTVNNIIYSPQDWPEQLQGDLYLPQREGLRPAVIMIHGGGWSGRSKVDMQSTAEKISKQGYVVLNINYRFAPEYRYPSQLQDMQQALLWLSDNASRFRVDLSRINSWGYSSGAHLAALLASSSFREGLSLAQQQRLPKIRSVIAGGIPADLSQYSGSPVIIPFLGQDRDENPELYAQASPINHISSDHPPVFLYHGKLDKLVEKEQSMNYYQALQENGIESDLYLHPWFGHFTMFLFGRDAEAKAIDFLNFHNA